MFLLMFILFIFINFFFQTSIKAIYWEITPHFNQYYSWPRFNKFYQNSPPPSITGTQNIKLPKYWKQAWVIIYAKVLLLLTITTWISITLLRFQLWLSALNSFTPFYSKIICLSDKNHEETVPFQKLTVE